MTLNPYAPPVAEVADIPHEDSSELPFFAVSLFKLAVLSLCTLSLYEIYWFYRHWKAAKRRDNSSVWPVPRAIFAILFCYPLFKRIRSSELGLALDRPLAAGLLATAWHCRKRPSCTSSLSRICTIASYFSVLFLLPVQAHANRLNEAQAPARRTATQPLLTAWNWIAIVLGGIFVVLGLAGTYMARHANGG